MESTWWCQQRLLFLTNGKQNSVQSHFHLFITFEDGEHSTSCCTEEMWGKSIEKNAYSYDRRKNSDLEYTCKYKSYMQLNVCVVGKFCAPGHDLKFPFGCLNNTWLCSRRSSAPSHLWLTRMCHNENCQNFTGHSMIQYSHIPCQRQSNKTDSRLKRPETTVFVCIFVFCFSVHDSLLRQLMVQLDAKNPAVDFYT